VDASAGEFVRLDVVTGLGTKIHVGGVTSIIIAYANEPGKFIATSGNKLMKLDWRAGTTELITELPANPLGFERFNDGKCDPSGRLFIGTVVESNGGFLPNGGSLYRLDGTVLTRVAQGFTVSNGMSWSNNPAHDDFYFNDSDGRKIYHFKYNAADGSISDQRVLIDCDTHEDFVADEYPDGQAIDEFGFVWSAMWNGGRIVKINPVTARVVDEIQLPRVKIPTSLAFGRYKGEYGLYMTTASTGLDPEFLFDSGKLHHISFQGSEIRNFNPNA